MPGTVGLAEIRKYQCRYREFLLVGVPIPYRNNMAVHQDKLIAAMKISEQVILALPSQSQIEAEQLKQIGAKACLVKPISANRLIPLLSYEQPYYCGTG